MLIKNILNYLYKSLLIKPLKYYSIKYFLQFETQLLVATLSTADLERGFPFISSSPGSSLLTSFQTFCSGNFLSLLAWSRELTTSACLRRARSDTLCSADWYVRRESLPPERRRREAHWIPSKSCVISSLTKMRRARNVLVATWRLRVVKSVKMVIKDTNYYNNSFCWKTLLIH